jgi:hypothetical protein
VPNVALYISGQSTTEIPNAYEAGHDMKNGIFDIIIIYRSSAQPTRSLLLHQMDYPDMHTTSPVASFNIETTDLHRVPPGQAATLFRSVMG